MKTKVIIMGAAGRDFHVFNTYFRDNDEYEVVAFTATQIPDIEGRKYPRSLAGSLYPDGIQIYAESDLEQLIEDNDVDQVIFAYSDLSHEDLMHKGSQVLAWGADFRLMGPKHTAIKSNKPLLSVCAARTGVGKSQTTRKISDLLQEAGYKVAVIRHPMPYGNLEDQICQRYETLDDLDKYHCTIEEREEYEPHINNGHIVYSGVDYQVILEQAEKEADIILWDGGNNDFPFYQSDLSIVLVDPLRPGHEVKYHPGETNFRMADVIIINKIDSASMDNINQVRQNISQVNPTATVIESASPILVKDYEQIKGKNVLVIEDGPTITHGGIGYGAGYMAAQKYGAAQIIDPRPYAVGSLDDTFKKYTHIEKVLPAMGYSDQQMKDLEATINQMPVDVIVSGTPIDLNRIMDVKLPIVTTEYIIQELGTPTLNDIVDSFIQEYVN